MEEAPTGESEAPTTQETAMTTPRDTGKPDTLMKMRVKLYRFRDSQWKERGAGYCRLLRDNDKKQISLLMRQDQTKKIVANFIVSDQIDLKPMAGADKAWTWFCIDYSEDAEGAKEMLACRFKNIEGKQEFKEKLEAAATFNTNAKLGNEELIWAEEVEDVIEEGEGFTENNEMAPGADD